MASYKLEAEATRDLDTIWRYGAKTFGEAQADLYFMAFFDHFQILADRPLAYPAVDTIRKGYRRSVFQKHSIYYRITANHIVVSAILGRQNALSRFQSS
ncbi:MAG: type II toxin-antitoxin system RelE/ParE family toxin [Pseudomonadota bacterium]